MNGLYGFTDSCPLSPTFSRFLSYNSKSHSIRLLAALIFFLFLVSSCLSLRILCWHLETAFYYLASEKKQERVTQWSCGGFVKTKCAVCTVRCLQHNSTSAFQYAGSQTTGTQQIDNGDKGNQLNGQTRSSLTTALAPPEMPALISRLTIAPWLSWSFFNFFYRFLLWFAVSSEVLQVESDDQWLLFSFGSNYYAILWQIYN